LVLITTSDRRGLYVGAFLFGFSISTRSSKTQVKPAAWPWQDTDHLIESQNTLVARRSGLCASESKQLERIEKLLNYVLYLLVFQVALTVGLVYLMQQLVSLWSY